jgi:hypothetical protein
LLAGTHGFIGGGDLEPDFRIFGKDGVRDLGAMGSSNDDRENSIFIGGDCLAIADVGVVNFGAPMPALNNLKLIPVEEVMGLPEESVSRP